MIPQLNKQYIRRYKPIAEVASIDTDNGSVRYRNEFGSECVMTTKQFEEFYEEVNSD